MSILKKGDVVRVPWCSDADYVVKELFYDNSDEAIVSWEHGGFDKLFSVLNKGTVVNSMGVRELEKRVGE